MYSISEEDYLGTIYRYRDDSGEIKANVIADKMEISNAAVTDMLKKLAKRKLVFYAPYKPVRFTKRGEELAGQLIRRHRIWEIFLHRIIGMPWEKVHDEAERLEHNASDDLINRMEEMLNFPEYDPHGASPETY
ncbi:MAG: metal-dependent transcriptional regulator [Ignavibacteriales bacterium]|nr:metal-dependent transcriptional regulator [Ignavibacteriales bacterium]